MSIVETTLLAARLPSLTGALTAREGLGRTQLPSHEKNTRFLKPGEATLVFCVTVKWFARPANLQIPELTCLPNQTGERELFLSRGPRQNETPRCLNVPNQSVCRGFMVTRHSNRLIFSSGFATSARPRRTQKPPHLSDFNWLGERVRTSDPLVPNQIQPLIENC
jgi:hypothetical protein